MVMLRAEQLSPSNLRTCPWAVASISNAQNTMSSGRSSRLGQIGLFTQRMPIREFVGAGRSGWVSDDQLSATLHFRSNGSTLRWWAL